MSECLAKPKKSAESDALKLLKQRVRETPVYREARRAKFVCDGPHAFALVEYTSNGDRLLELWSAYQEDPEGLNEEDIIVSSVFLSFSQVTQLWKLLRQFVPLLDQMADAAE